MSLARVSTSAIRAELSRRELQLEALQARRDRLTGQIAELDQEIKASGGSAMTTARTRTRASGRRRCPRNTMPLAEVLARTLKGKQFSVTEAADAVRNGGCRTTSPHFRLIVNQALIKDKRLKRVARGTYMAT